MKEAVKRQQDFPFVSAVLVAVNIIIYLVCTFTGSLLYNKGGLGVYDILYGKEYGRIIWSMFLHSSVSHLGNNMILLFFMGAMIEREVGRVWYTLFYFMSGIAGNLLSLWIKFINGDASISIGASGAVFGLDGVLLALALFYRKKLPNLTGPKVALMIFLSLNSGFTARNVDNAAHVGGLLAGFVAGLIMCLINRITTEKNGEVLN